MIEENKKNSILIVDDEDANIVALTYILENDFELYTAINGQGAINAAKMFQPDLILLDILMPEMDGYEVFAELKASDKTREIPVIFITGLSESSHEIKGLALGATDYISKPFVNEIVKLRVNNQMKIINQMRLIIKKEFEEASSRAKMDFLVRMSHELLTPMNCIIGMLQLLKMTNDADMVKMYHEEIEMATGNLLELIHNLLEISENDETPNVLDNVVFSFDTVFEKIMNELGRSVLKKQQQLTFDIEPLMPLAGDEERLTKVIRNLLINAHKFTPERGHINISVKNIKEDNDFVTLQVEISDNGIGIADEHKDSVFNLFEQADKSVTRKHGGIGLGLPISKRIIEMMGGKIWVETELDKGSKFIFTCNINKHKPKQTG